MKKTGIRRHLAIQVLFLVAAVTPTLALSPPTSTITISSRITQDDIPVEPIPDTFLIRFVPGGMLVVEDGHTVTIEGTFTAGNWQVFELQGTGVVRFGDGGPAQVDPRWWGAQPDGTDPERTTAALQAAIDTGRRVVIPNGTFLTETLTVRRLGTVIQGQNKSASILKLADSGDPSAPLIRFDQDPLDPDMNGSHGKISDLTLLGTATSVGASMAGIEVVVGTRSQIDNVRIRNFGYGIHAPPGAAAWIWSIDHCDIRDNKRAGVLLEGGAHGWVIEGQTEIVGSPYGVIAGRVLEPFAIDPDFSGVVGQSIVIRDSTVEGIRPDPISPEVGGIGVYVATGQKGILIDGVYFEDVERAAYQLGSAETSQLVENPTFTNNFLSAVPTAVHVGAVRFGSFTNNYLADAAPVFFDVSTTEPGFFDRVHVNANRNLEGNGRLLSPALSSTILLGQGGEGSTFELWGETATGEGAVLDVATAGTADLFNDVLRIFAGEVQLSRELGAPLVRVRVGQGAPEGTVAAPVGSLYLRDDGAGGATLYVKESGGSGSSGWVAK